MSEWSRQVRRLAPPLRCEYERIVEQFEQAWLAGPSTPPDLDSLLPPCVPLRKLVLVGLVKVDLEARGASGEVHLEEYLSRYPELADEDAREELRAWQARVSRQAGTPAAPPGYSLLELLGRGGMGTVYLARCEALKRRVALKFLRPGLLGDENALERFRREADLIAALPHPHIVQIHQVGEHRGEPFLALEYCPGGSLHDRLKDGPLPAREAARVVIQVARAVQQAHDRQIIHRDLKPANVLLTADGAPKVTDFGLARRLDEAALTLSGDVVGTPHYMAPEQARGGARHVGPAADVYSLGAILYHCLVGAPPFSWAAREGPAAAPLHREPLDPSAFAKVPRDLEAVCLKCLRKDPALRYPSAAALADDLERFLRHQPTRARPLGVAGRAGRWARRNPMAAVALGVVLLALVGLSAGSLLLWRAKEEAVRQRRRAEVNFRRALDAVVGVTLKVKAPKYADAKFDALRKDVIDQAAGAIQAFIDERRTDPTSRYETGCAHLYRGVLAGVQGEHARAAEAYGKAISCLGLLVTAFPADAAYRQEYAQGYTYLAQAHRAQGLTVRSDEALRQALKHYRQAVRLAPDDYRGLNYLAHFLSACADHRLRDPAEAVVLAEKAVALAPAVPSCRNTLGMARYYAGQWKAAIDDLERANRGRPPELKGYGWYYLAMAHWRLGDKGEALCWFEKARGWKGRYRAPEDGVSELDEEAAGVLGVGAPSPH